MGKKRPLANLVDPDAPADSATTNHGHLHLSQPAASSRRARTNVEKITTLDSPPSSSQSTDLPIVWDCLPSTKAHVGAWIDDPNDCGEDLVSQKISSGFFETAEEFTEDDETTRRKVYPSDNPLIQWTPFIDQYVSELLRQEALEDMYTALQWNGLFFERKSLKQLGLRLQLGHPPEERCLLPDDRSAERFIVIDRNGIHPVALDFCSCHMAQPRHIQLLRARLFPGTITDPLTAATFEALNHFQLLSFMSKIPAFDYYHTLARCSDNTGLLKLPDRYSSFLRIVREWRHVRLLKRMGRGHSPLGISSVSGNPQGGCALICPACPQPGINVPADHEKLKSWVHTLYVGLDANFRLKHLNISNAQRDPCLNQGLAYVVDPTAFSSHLAMFQDTPDDNSTGECNNHDAIKSASIRGSKGTAASGAGTVECIRHDFKRPNAVGDLQKGERYLNMDYFFLSSLRYNSPPNLLISYDIACQWHRNLLSRCATYPPELTAAFLSCTPRYAINKMHITAHRQQCQVNFSLNLMPNVGRIDGEAPERGWAAINAVANSTKEMGPGSRNDTLDDHFGDYNWRKIVSMCAMFLRKVKDALKNRSEQVQGFEEFTVCLDPVSVRRWLDAVTQWEADPSKPNPFYSAEKRVSEHEVRLKLAEEEEQALRDGLADSVHKKISGSMMLSQGLELEAHQYSLKCDISKLGKHATELQLATLDWQANWWTAHATPSSTLTDLTAKGKHAYAMRQARIRLDMRSQFEREWEDTLVLLDKTDLSVRM